MLERRVRRENGVVRLDNGIRECRCGVYTELELGLLAVVGGQTFEHKGTETGTSSATERVEDEEALEAIAVIGKTANTVHDSIDQPSEQVRSNRRRDCLVLYSLLADGVMTTGV